jgi:phosphate transport system permease protein
MSNSLDNFAAKTKAVHKVEHSLKRRHRAERNFKRFGLGAIFLGLSFVAILFVNIVSNGYSAFMATHIALDVTFDAEYIDKNAIADGNYRKLSRNALSEEFSEVSGRRNKRELYQMISSSAEYALRDMVLADPSLIGQTKRIWLLADDEIDMAVKGIFTRDVPENERVVSNQEFAWLDKLTAEGRVEKFFNWSFFTNGDSREPEQAGIGGAIVGSFYTLLVTLVLSFPIGVAAAVYLEEFAPKNKLTDIIEVNINNLAAVPSIVFGLLGLAVFINLFGLPRSAPLVGGLVLTLMTLPTIIIASRAALKSVPPSIREAALGVGASKMQMVTHHVLPLAMPGMLTGTIIGMAQALGESAPLLMIGMVAFIVNIPGGPVDPSTVLPVQVFLWSDSPERAFVERTSAAIMVLLGFLVLMNILAVVLRRRFERRW